MTRMQFGGGPEDVYLVPDSDGDLQQGVGVVIRLWSTETGSTPIIDLLDIDSQPITYVTTSTGSDGRAPGQIAPFYGPDGAYEMWAAAENHPRFLMQASNLGSVLGTAREQLLQHISELNGHSTRVQDLLDVDPGTTGAAADGQLLTWSTTAGQWKAEDPAASSLVIPNDTLWVAANNAPASFDSAPYQCDGTADEVQINQAIDNVFGLKVGLSPGTFNLAAPVQLLGANDIALEVSRYLRGSGTYATKLVVGSGVSAGIVLGNVVCPHVCDLSITVVGASHGIYSTASLGGSASHRSFFHGSIKNMIIKGPADGSHTGWAMKLGTGYRYVAENIEVKGTGNGIQVLNEDSSPSAGDAVFLRCYVDIVGNSGIAYNVSSVSNNPRQLVFIACHGKTVSTSTGTIGWKFDGIGSPSHVRVIDGYLEQFATSVSIEAPSFDIDVDLARVILRNGSTLFSMAGIGNRVRCAGAYVEPSATITLIDDDNTNTARPNIVGPLAVYADTGSTVNADLVDTVILRDITTEGPGTFSAAVRRPGQIVNRRSVTLTDAATINTDASLGDDFRVTLGGNRTLAAPTNPTDGQHITVLVTQDATGSRTLTWNAAFVFGTITNALTTTASRRDLFEFIYNSALAKWLVLNASKNLT